MVPHKFSVSPENQVYVEFQGSSLDHGMPDPEVYGWLDPDEAFDMAAELISVALQAKKRASGS